MPRLNRGPQLRPHPRKGGVYYIFWTEKRERRSVSRERSTHTRNLEEAERFLEGWRPNISRVKRSKKRVVGLIYFVRTPSAIKVGFAKSLARRMADLQTSNCEELTILGAIEGNYETEKAILLHLSEYRIRGEWFRDVPPVVNYIEGLITERGVSVERERRACKHDWEQVNQRVIDGQRCIKCGALR